MYSILSILINKDIVKSWNRKTYLYMWWLFFIFIDLSWVFWSSFNDIFSFFLDLHENLRSCKRSVFPPRRTSRTEKHLFTLFVFFAFHREWGFRFGGRKSTQFLKIQTFKYFLKLVFNFNNRQYQIFGRKFVDSVRNFAARWSTTYLNVVFAYLGLLCLWCNFWLVLTDWTIVKLTHGLVDGSPNNNFG